MNPQTQWQKLAEPYFPETQVEQIFNYLKRQYRLPTRHYHNLNHISDILQKFKSANSEVENPAIIEFAIWFHDVIYNPLSKKNEFKSAERASKYLAKSTLPHEQIQLIHGLIEATEKHIPLEDYPDSQLFLDLDLSILGSPSEQYFQYTQQVRREYFHVPKILYQRGRAKALQSFLERERIFYTDEMREKYELKARENIQKEMRNMEKK